MFLKRRLFFYFVVILFYSLASAQSTRLMNAGELHLAIKKLNTLGTALYLAAHPDDENTAVIAYLANDRLLRAAYLSITRGDGGQNLIGSEQREWLGLIRTQELLQARKIDGGEQFFTRANDFGFSKNAKETLEIWDKNKILSDIVWVIRKFRPDVIINRFPPTRDAGHGHHEASALLAAEAFKAAADPQMFPEQLQFVSVWQAKRLVWNSYNRNFTNTPPEGASYVKAQISTYNTLLGKTHTVIAAESRSMHRSQGFGSARVRSERNDFFTHVAGEVAQTDLLDGINLSWNRIKGGEVIGNILRNVYEKFKPENPSASVPQLLIAYQLLDEMNSIKDPEVIYWRSVKLKEIENVLVSCLGLWCEANGRQFAVSQGEDLKIRLETVKYCDYPVKLKKVKIFNELAEKAEQIYEFDPELGLTSNKLFDSTVTVKINTYNKCTQPYWLEKDPRKGIFELNDQSDLIGKAENAAALSVVFTFEIDNHNYYIERPVTYKWTKADEGELYRSLEVTPEVMVNMNENTILFANGQPEEVDVTIKAGKVNTEGILQLEAGANWRIEPLSFPYSIKNKDEEITVKFKIYPSTNAESSELKAYIKNKEGKDKKEARGLHRISYSHLPILTFFPTAKAKLVKLELVSKVKKVGYIDGAGDEIPRHLRQLGIEVTMLGEKELQQNLTRYDAIIVGVRAYNTEERLKHHQAELMDYVKNGGTLVVQYQTSQRLVIDQIGPYPFKIARDQRVTVEETPVKVLNKNHQVLTSPNKINEKDFEGWVQERGLYFASEWDKNYQTVLACCDPGEKEMEGGVLYAEYGKGRYIYTGYAFFREIPAGVPGAIRLFINMISK